MVHSGQFSQPKLGKDQDQSCNDSKSGKPDEFIDSRIVAPMIDVEWNKNVDKKDTKKYTEKDKYPTVANGIEKRKGAIKKFTYFHYPGLSDSYR
jgi:hypothetical protein